MTTLNGSLTMHEPSTSPKPERRSWWSRGNQGFYTEVLTDWVATENCAAAGIDEDAPLSGTLTYGIHLEANKPAIGEMVKRWQAHPESQFLLKWVLADADAKPLLDLPLVFHEKTKYGERPDGIYEIGAFWRLPCSRKTYEQIALANCSTFWPGEKPWTLQPTKEPEVLSGGFKAMFYIICILTFVGLMTVIGWFTGAGNNHGGSRPAATSRR